MSLSVISLFFAVLHTHSSIVLRIDVLEGTSSSFSFFHLCIHFFGFFVVASAAASLVVGWCGGVVYFFACQKCQDSLPVQVVGSRE